MGVWCIELYSWCVMLIETNLLIKNKTSFPGSCHIIWKIKLMFLTLWTNSFNFHCVMTPIDWITMVADDDTFFNKDGKACKCSLFRLCTSAVFTGWGQREIISSTGHCHVTEAITGENRFQSKDRGRHWLWKHTHTNTYYAQCLRDILSWVSKVWKTYCSPCNCLTQKHLVNIVAFPCVDNFFQLNLLKIESLYSTTVFLQPAFISPL